ncbi:hypothetical protein B9Z55_017474 [Caenorhabditis nigoni]|nr:hypothetical protein B9Z55_017474 [Caenorhabditis nigoni]
MDVPLRRNLAERLPKIRSAERATPLKLRWLRLTPIDVTINEFIYRVQLVAVGPDARKLMKLYDDRIDFDLTEYGKRDYQESLTAGDIVIEANDLESWKRAKNSVERYQAEIQFLLNCGRTKDQYGKNLTPDVKLYIKFIILEYNDKIIKTEYVECRRGRRLRDAAKYITTKLLGGRMRNLTANKLTVTSYGGVLRLPAELRIKASEIEVFHNASSVLNSISPIMNKESFPLKQISITNDRYESNIDNYRHPIIESAEKLFIVTGKDDWKRPFAWERMIFEVQTKVVRFGYSLMSSLNQLNRIITTLTDSWIIAEKHFLIECHNPCSVLRFMTETQNMENAEFDVLEHKGCDLFHYTIFFPMKSGSRLLVYLNKAPAGYALGYLTTFDIPMEYQGLVVLLSLAYFCTGILAVFEKRFYIVCAYQATFWKWFRYIWLIGHYLVVTGLYSSFLLLIPDQKGLKEKVFRTLPCLPQYIYKAPILVITENYTYHFIVSCLFIIIYTVEGTLLSGFVILTTKKQLQTRKMSRNAFQLQKSTFIALLTQMLVPLIMIIAPCTYGWASLVAHYQNQALMNFAMITGSLHGALSTVIMVTVHRSYREAIQDVFRSSSRRESTNDHNKYLFVVINY